MLPTAEQAGPTITPGDVTFGNGSSALATSSKLFFNSTSGFLASVRRARTPAHGLGRLDRERVRDRQHCERRLHDPPHCLQRRPRLRRRGPGILLRHLHHRRLFIDHDHLEPLGRQPALRHRRGYRESLRHSGRLECRERRAASADHQHRRQPRAHRIRHLQRLRRCDQPRCCDRQQHHSVRCPGSHPGQTRSQARKRSASSTAHRPRSSPSTILANIGVATSSPSANVGFSIATTTYFAYNVGIGTTTPGTALSIQNVGNFAASATSTFYQGLNLTSGCYAINGTCLAAFTGTAASSNFARQQQHLQRHQRLQQRIDPSTTVSPSAPRSRSATAAPMPPATRRVSSSRSTARHSSQQAR